MNGKRYISQVLFLGVFILLTLKQRVNLWLMIFLFSLGLALFFGRVYCGWIAPIAINALNVLIVVQLRLSVMGKLPK